MDDKTLNNIHKRLTEKIKKYIHIIRKEYEDYIPLDVLKRLDSIDDYEKILKIYDYGEINAYANNKSINMPLCAEKVIEFFSKIPGYGIDKNHKIYNSDNMIVNNNTFLTYLKHVFVSGTDTEGYYDDILLHEVMHFCGGDSASVLKEGINELLTRKVAQKHNLRTSCCGYPKEVKLAYELMDSFGEDIVTSLGFIKGFDKEVEFIRDNLGDTAAKLYIQVRNDSEKEFQEKYYSHMKEFSGVVGTAKKVLFYKKIDYSSSYKLIDNYLKSEKIKNR